MERARNDFDAAATIFRDTPGRQMELAKALWNMAITYSVEEKFRQARKCLEEAVSIYTSGAVQGAEHSPDFAQCCHNFANMRYNSGNDREALVWVNRAIEIYCELQDGSEGTYGPQFETLRRFAEWLAQTI